MIHVAMESFLSLTVYTKYYQTKNRVFDLQYSFKIFCSCNFTAK